jgi:hypothetical protein
VLDEGILSHNSTSRTQGLRLVRAAERFGAPAQIRISELAIHAWPPGTRIMAALTGYLDDSHDGSIFALAGYVGGERHWEVFEEQWGRVLDRYEVPYFHMKEFDDPGGPYKKWLPIKEHKRQVASFFGAVARAIGRSQLKGFGSIVRIKDLKRFNQRHGQNIEPYPLAAYGCMTWIGKANPDVVVSAIFDRCERITSRLKKATIYCESDIYYAGTTNLIQPIPLRKDVTFRKVRPIQAADFAAWEIRRHHLRQNDWWELEDRPRRASEVFLQLMEWSENKGLQPRKSLEALLENAELPGVLWDYNTLCEAHEARGGVWRKVMLSSENPSRSNPRANHQSTGREAAKK